MVQPKYMPDVVEDVNAEMQNGSVFLVCVFYCVPVSVYITRFSITPTVDRSFYSTQKM